MISLFSLPNFIPLHECIVFELQFNKSDAHPVIAQT